MKKKGPTINQAASLLGKKGGKAASKSMTPEQKAERARKGGLARQAKLRAEKEGKSFAYDR